MTAHTPGPWKVEVNPDDVSEVWGIVSAEGKEIVETDAGFYPPSLNDARLIAAAPELLEALRVVIASGGLERPGSDANAANALSVARAALAKVRGE